MDQKYVKRRYFTKREAGSLSALSGFLRNNKYSDKEQVESILSELKTFNLHRPIRKKFPRRPVMCPFIDYVWSSDVIFYKTIKGSNRNHAYVSVSYTHLRAHETVLDIVCRL